MRNCLSHTCVSFYPFRVPICCQPQANCRGWRKMDARSKQKMQCVTGIFCLGLRRIIFRRIEEKEKNL